MTAISVSALPSNHYALSGTPSVVSCNVKLDLSSEGLVLAFLDIRLLRIIDFGP